jgi:capsular polysaccharide biosynthesis protein
MIRRAPSYAHWLVDQLPTVRGLKRYQAATGRTPTVLIEEDPPDWILKTLSLVGVDTPVPFDMSVAKTDRLVVASCRESVPRNQPVYEPSKDDIDWLTSKMKSRVSLGSADYPDRIYISRENIPGRGRNVTNRAELNSVLHEFDIEVCTPETRSLPEQIRLYSNADVIVGPHGAGLTNMIFSENLTVIELLSTPYPMYQHLAQISGHEYRFLQCGDGEDHHAPIEVDTDALRTLLADIGMEE